MKPRRRGRPLQRAKRGTRQQISMVVSAATKNRLRAIARKSGCTMAAEVERRVLRSFFIDELIASRLTVKDLAAQAPPGVRFDKEEKAA